MYLNQRTGKRFDTNWQGRVLLSSGNILGTRMLNVSEGGAAIESPYAMSVGTELRLEFDAKCGPVSARLRAKVTAVHNIVLSNNSGARVGLRFDYMDPDHKYKLNNVLRMLEERVGYRNITDKTSEQWELHDHF